jgi:hypothetical protein
LNQLRTMCPVCIMFLRFRVWNAFGNRQIWMLRGDFSHLPFNKSKEYGITAPTFPNRKSPKPVVPSPGGVRRWCTAASSEQFVFGLWIHMFATKHCCEEVTKCYHLLLVPFESLWYSTLQWNISSSPCSIDDLQRHTWGLLGVSRFQAFPCTLNHTWRISKKMNPLPPWLSWLLWITYICWFYVEMLDTE